MNEEISDISEEQISFRKKRKKGENKDTILFYAGFSPKTPNTIKNASQAGSKNDSIGLINNFLSKDIPKENDKKESIDDSDSCSSLDIQKAGINSKNTRIKGNKHSIVDIKQSSKATNLKKITISKNSKSQSSLNSNSENSYKKIDLEGLLNLKNKTILGVNLLHEEELSPKNKRQLETSSLTGSMQMYFDSNKRKKIQHKINKARQLIKQNQ